MPNQFRIYRSTDVGAPQLTGQTGSLIEILSASLVAGYGNPLTSSLGWTIAYSASVSSSIINQAAFQMPSNTSRSFFLRIMDDYSTHGSVTNEAHGKFDEILYGIDSPTFTNDIWIRKSNLSNNSSRPWIIVGDNKTFYMFIKTADSVATSSYYSWGFGMFDSYITNDYYNIFIMGRNLTGNPIANEGSDMLSLVPTTTIGNYIARPYTRVFLTSSAWNPTSVVAVGKHGDGNKGNSTRLYGQLTFTNPTDSGLYLSPVYIHETNGNIRGKMRGFWQFCHDPNSVGDQDTFSGNSSGTLSGKTFTTISSSVNRGVYIMETSNTLS